MSFSIRSRVSLAFSLVLASMAGCWSQGPSTPSDMPQLVSCKLTLTQEGAPLEDATVFLNPVDGSEKWGAGGKTDAAGTVVVYTNGFYKGAPPGKYKVVVQKTETGPSRFPAPPPPEDPGYEKWAAQWANKQAGEIRPVYTFVEEKYTKAETTPHEIEIFEGKPFSASLDVGEKIKKEVPRSR